MIFSTTRRRWSVAAFLLLLIVLVTWLFLPDRRTARAKELRQQLFGPQAKQLAPDERQKKWTEYRELTKQMTPAQRQQLSAEGRKKKNAEIGRYFRMSAKEKTSYLDQQIRAMERQRQAWQSKAKTGAAGKGPGPRSNSPGGKSEKERDQRRQQFLDSSSPTERALLSQFRKELDARRRQLGLAPGGGGPKR